jgi:ABC-type Zn uptake system ZnuABC Zn-binding protein ZnuA
MIQRLFCLSLLVLLAACKPPLDAPSASRGGKPHVYVANYPLQFFAERLGGDQVEVQIRRFGSRMTRRWRAIRRRISSC